MSAPSGNSKKSFPNNLCLRVVVRAEQCGEPLLGRFRHSPTNRLSRLYSPSGKSGTFGYENTSCRVSSFLCKSQVALVFCMMTRLTCCYIGDWTMLNYIPRELESTLLRGLGANSPSSRPWTAAIGQDHPRQKTLPESQLRQSGSPRRSPAGGRISLSFSSSATPSPS